MATVWAFFLLVLSRKILCDLDYGYHHYEELTGYLKQYVELFPKISPHLYSIGQSHAGRELWVLEVSAAGNSSNSDIPNVKLIGNIHGNEPVGREVLLHFLEFLGNNFPSNSKVKQLLENTRVHVLPSMNPDGFEKSTEGECDSMAGRGNWKNMDLNRNFPDYFHRNVYRTYPPQPESEAVQGWMKKIPFVLSASLHGGALVANYPFDTVKEKKTLSYNLPSTSPDDDVFIHLATTYATSHPQMHLSNASCSGMDNFSGGITNGAAWYSIIGGMQDYNYWMHGCMELTLELSCCKYPSAEELPKMWDQNRDALLEYLMQAHKGVQGKVYNKQTSEPISGAVLKIAGREMNFFTHTGGRFWRLLLPGNYSLQVTSEGYPQTEFDFTVPETEPSLTTLEIGLGGKEVEEKSFELLQASETLESWLSVGNLEEGTDVPEMFTTEDISDQSHSIVTYSSSYLVACSVLFLYLELISMFWLT